MFSATEVSVSIRERGVEPRSAFAHRILCRPLDVLDFLLLLLLYSHMRLTQSRDCGDNRIKSVCVHCHTCSGFMCEKELLIDSCKSVRCVDQCHNTVVTRVFQLLCCVCDITDINLHHNRNNKNDFRLSSTL